MPVYGVLWHAVPLQVIVVVGVLVSTEVTAARTVDSAAPAGAPPDWPALAIQSRNAFRSASSIHPEELVQVV